MRTLQKARAHHLPIQPRWRDSHLHHHNLFNFPAQLAQQANPTWSAWLSVWRKRTTTPATAVAAPSPFSACPALTSARRCGVPAAAAGSCPSSPFPPPTPPGPAWPHCQPWRRSTPVSLSTTLRTSGRPAGCRCGRPAGAPTSTRSPCSTCAAAAQAKERTRE